MKISLITACYNSAKTIATAMESVLSQKGVELEYIVVDGGSTDGTVEIVEEFSRKERKDGFEFKWISEKDRGMYDAINKGIAMATGDVVGILNADDMLEREDTLAHVVEGFNAEAQSRREAEEQFRRRAEEKVDEWLDGVSNEKFVSVLDLFLDEKLARGEYRFKGDGGREAMRDGAIRFFREFSRRIVQLSDGRCVYFTPDERARKRNSDNAISWAEYAVHAVTSSGKLLLGKDYRERLYNRHKDAGLSSLENIIRDENCMYRLIDAHPENDAVLFVGVDNEGARMEVVTRLDVFGNADANLAEVTVIATRKKNLVIPPPKSRPLTEVVETVAKHQAAGFSPSTTQCSLADFGAECKGGTKNISGGAGRVEAVYADVRFVKDDLETTVRYYGASHWRPWMHNWGYMPPHPSVYIRREVFERLGGYKLGYQISADFELMVRFLCRNRIRTAYLPESVVKMRMGGKSTKNWKANVLLNVENVRANRENGYFSCFAMMLPKYLFKIWGFVFKRGRTCSI